VAGTPAAAAASRVLATFRTTDDAWEVTLTSAELHSTLAGIVPKGVFVVVALDVTNTSALSDSFPYAALVLTDGAGTAYTWDGKTTEAFQSNSFYGVNENYRGLHTSTVFASGDLVHTVVAFDVPVDATGLTLSGPGWPAAVPLGL